MSVKEAYRWIKSHVDLINECERNHITPEDLADGVRPDLTSRLRKLYKEEHWGNSLTGVIEYMSAALLYTMRPPFRVPNINEFDRRFAGRYPHYLDQLNKL